MDRLRATAFVRQLNGRIFLAQYQAVAALTPELLQEGLVLPAPARGTTAEGA